MICFYVVGKSFIQAVASILTFQGALEIFQETHFCLNPSNKGTDREKHPCSGNNHYNYCCMYLPHFIIPSLDLFALAWKFNNKKKDVLVDLCARQMHLWG